MTTDRIEPPFITDEEWDDVIDRGYDLPRRTSHLLTRVIYRSPVHECDGDGCPFLAEMETHRA